MDGFDQIGEAAAPATRVHSTPAEEETRTVRRVLLIASRIAFDARRLGSRGPAPPDATCTLGN